MVYETVASFGCQWKVTGINRKVAHQNWVQGIFHLQRQNNVWRCALALACNPKREPYTYQLSKKIKNLGLKTRILIDLEDGVTIHIQHVAEAQLGELSLLLNRIQLDQLIPALKTEMSSPIAIQRSPLASKSGNSSRVQASPIQFTGSVKEGGMSRRERMQAEALEDEHRRIRNSDRSSESNAADDENANRGSQRFLESSQRKSQETMSAVKAKSFYSSSAPVRTYGSLGTLSKPRKSPGLLPLYPERAPRARLGELHNQSPTYSWSSRVLTSPSPGSNSLQGFSNLGNTCYMNAILQSLLTLDSFSSDLMHTNTHYSKLVPPEQRRSYLFFMLFKLLQVKRKEGASTEVKKQVLTQVKKTITSSAKRFSGYEQHDAHEFLGQILDQLKEEIVKLTKTPDENEDTAVASCSTSPDGTSPPGDSSPTSKHPNPTRDNFEFKVSHQITCTECSEMVDTCETFHDLSIDMPPKKALEPTSSIQDALDHFFLDEQLEYTCEQCGGKQARVRHKFTKLPRVLVLHLKRYTYNCVTSSNTKLGQNIIIPKFLTLRSQCEQETQPALPVRAPFSSTSKATPVSDLLDEVPGKSPVPDRRSSTSRRKLDLTSEATSAEEKFEEAAADSMDWVLKMSKETAAEENKTRERIDSLTMQSMTDEEMLKIAMERSMTENGINPQDSEQVTAQTSTSDINLAEMGETSENAKPEQLQVVKDGHLIWGPKDEPPMKRTRFDEHTDSAYSSFTEESSEEKGARMDMGEIAKLSNDLTMMENRDEGECLTNNKEEASEVVTAPVEDKQAETVPLLNGHVEKKPEIHVDLSLSDEENKENYTPLRSPDGVSNEDKQTSTVPDGSRLHKEEELDEEAQLKQAIENSLKDQEQYLLLNHEDELEKAKELSLQDHTPGKMPGPQRPMVWNLKRSKEEEQALKQHAEQGDLPYSYQLVSVVSHLGSSSSLGHYISDVYDARKRTWLSWDDTRVSKMQEDDIRKSRERTGYIFFYVAKETVQDLEEYFYQQRRHSRSLSLNSALSTSLPSLATSKTVTVQPGSATKAPVVQVFPSFPGAR